MNRREFIASSAALAASAALPSAVLANVPKPYDWDAVPPLDNRAEFIKWMVANRGENPLYLGQRFDRCMVQARNFFTVHDKRGFLMTPREEFCLARNLPRVYDIDFLDIGFGVTISGPGLVGRMTSSLNLQKGEKVLEIGTGSGYQAAYLANMTDKVWSIEIIKPLFERTGGIYEDVIKRGYTEFSVIQRRNADGYYGWEEAAPFDKIVVTCGIDHVPPPLLQQLKPGGIMVIPVGPPGAQHVLKVVKNVDAEGRVSVARSDIYNGYIIPFVPFTSLVDGKIKGTHNGGGK
jgi:protein-L-isoaspartate(D-aspartate) O-methyltransferase